MKYPRSSLSMRTSLAAACAVLLGSAAFAQSNPSTSSRDATYQGTSTDSSRRNQSATGSYDATATGSQHQTHANTTASNDRATAGGKLGFMDRRFVSKAADEGKAEVDLAKLASERATNPEVKNFAQKLVEDHTAVNAELTTLATQKNVKLDTDDDKDRSYKRLSKKSGADFDQEFVEHMIDAHEKDIKMFEKAAKDAKDADIRSFAAKHVDHLREHLRTAEGLRTSTMPTGRDDGTSGRATSEGTSSNDGVGTSGAGAATSGIGASGQNQSTTSGSSSQTGSDTNSSADQKRGGKP